MVLGCTPSNMSRKGAPSGHVTAAYIVFSVLAMAMHHLVAQGALSSIMTISVMIRCLAFVLLAAKSLTSGSAAGISVRALSLDAFSLCCQLSSTVWLQGYLPADASGDGVFQITDVCSLLLVLWLLHHVMVERRNSYQEEQDSCPVLPLMLLCFLLAALLHADLNSKPLFDMLWMTGLFAGVVAVLPQLWLIGKTGGRVEALTGHYIAAMAVSRALNGMFLWVARRDISCKPWIFGFNHAVYAITFAHVLHILFLADFAFFYVKAVASKGLTSDMDLGNDLAQWV